MSDTAQGPGWWMASDSKWYPPPAAAWVPPAPAMTPGEAKALYLKGHRGHEVMRALHPGAGSQTREPGTAPTVPVRTEGVSDDAVPAVPLPPTPTYATHTGQVATRPGAYPPAAPAVAWSPENNGMAIASLVVAVAGLTLCVGLFSPAAIPLGHIAQRQIRRSGGREQGAGLAVAGLVLGYLALAGWIVFVILLAWASNEADASGWY